jgi:hypothetical protein
MDQIVRTGVRPTIPGFEIHPVPLQSGRHVLVLRIPRSWTGPHQIGQPGSFRFWGRNSNGKYQLDVDELRAAFRLGPDIAERIRLFRMERLSHVIGMTHADENPSKIVLHFVPLSNFATRTPINLMPIRSDRGILAFLCSGSPRMNLDGFITSNEGPGGIEYAQVFRDGALEIVRPVIPHPQRGVNWLSESWFDRQIMKYVEGMQRIYARLAIEPPVVALLSLLGMGDRYLGGERTFARFPLGSNELLCPDVMLERIDRPVDVLTFPIVNMAWNAGGYDQSLNYDAEGKLDIKLNPSELSAGRCRPTADETACIEAASAWRGA